MTDFPMDVLLFSGSNMQKSVPATPELDLKRLGGRGEIISALIQERRVLGTSSHHTLNLDKALGKHTKAPTPSFTALSAMQDVASLASWMKNNLQVATSILGRSKD